LQPVRDGCSNNVSGRVADSKDGLQGILFSAVEKHADWVFT
jgi:hypothetical protein